MSKQRRLRLHDIFKKLSDNCYFAPPNNLYMNYPCIVYKEGIINDIYADDIKFISYNRYTVTVIDDDPDSILAEEVSKLRYCRQINKFTKDNLNHYVFNLYF